MRAAVARGPAASGGTCQRERREARVVGRLEGQSACSRRERRGAGPGVRRGKVERVLDGDAHVRQAQLGLDGAVHELDERVDEALRVDEDVDVLVVDIV